jgi:hypothetical protein
MRCKLNFDFELLVIQAFAHTYSSVTMRTTLAPLLLWSAGSIAAAFAKECPIADTSIIAHTGTPVGTEEVVDGCRIRVLSTNDAWA